MVSRICSEIRLISLTPHPWTVKTVLRLEEYDGHDDMSWVLLDAIGGGAGSSGETA